MQRSEEARADGTDKRIQVLIVLENKKKYFKVSDSVRSGT